jgi:hypothetical protein
MKKTTAMVTSLIVGGTLLLGTAIVNASQLSGYEAYKAAVLQTKDLKDGTANLRVSVTDNGKELASASSNVKLDLNSKVMSSKTTLSSNAGATTFESYIQDGKSISKSSLSDVYNVRQGKKNDLNKEAGAINPQVVKSVEAVVDALVGNMKDGFTVADNGDGTKKITVNLNEGQVTPLINAVTSMAVTAGSNARFHNNDAKEINIKDVVPKLQSDVKISAISSTADVDKDNVLKDQDVTVTITGKDDQGALHSIVISAHIDFSNINSTTPDKVDLTGKQIKTVADHFRGKEQK